MRDHTRARCTSAVRLQPPHTCTPAAGSIPNTAANPGAAQALTWLAQLPYQ